jgi:catechol 2,3-dioxygenase-like lactoylglutathione lyase family enzyme
MRMLAILASVAVAACSGTAAADPPKAAAGVQASTDVPTDIRRLSLIVRDIDASLKLYRDVLGLKVNYDTVVEMSGVALPAGEPGAKARLVLLNGNDPWVGWIGMLQWLDPPLPLVEHPTRLGIGGHVLVTNTDDAVKRCEMAKAVPGVKFTAEARLQVYPGRNGAPDIRVMGCNFFDPDGLLIELNQILK